MELGFNKKENTYTDGFGRTIHNIHKETKECRTYGCVIHNPTKHHMRGFLTSWRSDRFIMERVCPHGVGHLDPDNYNWIERNYGTLTAQSESFHGCDGCCRK
jgi:hypothetical protein